VRRAARVDANQDAVISALRAAGASVLVIGQPVDLLVGLAGRTLLMEVKNPDSRYGKKGANENQQSFMSTWNGGPVSLVDGPDAALRALGVIR
jgi:hypothetical protein